MHPFSYTDIFKLNYTLHVNRTLNTFINNIQNKNNSLDLCKVLAILYQNVTKELLLNIKHQHLNTSKELIKARNEILQKTREIACTEEFYSSKIIKDMEQNAELQAYNQAMHIPNVVESMYFDVLQYIFNSSLDYNTLKGKNSLKYDLFAELATNFQLFVSEFQSYLKEISPIFLDHLSEQQKGERIQSERNKVSSLEKELDVKKLHINTIKNKLNENLLKQYEKQNLISILNYIKNSPHLTIPEKTNVQKYIDSLNKEIDMYKKAISVINNDLSNNYKEFNKKAVDRINSLNYINHLENTVFYMTKYLKEFIKDGITEAILKETLAIINKDENQIRIYEILKYHIMYFAKMHEIFYIILEYEDEIKQQVKPYIKQDNYKDILYIKTQAKHLLEKLTSKSIKVEQHADVVESLLTTILYIYITEGISYKCSKFSLVHYINNYINASVKLSPLKFNKPTPRNFISYTEFKTRNKFNSQSDFNEQFNKYKSTFSLYEAQKLVRFLIKSGQAGLDESDVLTPIKQYFYFQEDQGVGGVLFIQLNNYDWIIASTLGMVFKIKKYKEQELSKYPTFFDITRNTEKNFLSQISYVLLPRVPIGTKFLDSTLKLYPVTHIGNMRDDGAIMHPPKVEHYQRYFEFWKDFYGMDIVKNPIFYDRAHDKMPSTDIKDLLTVLEKLFKDTLNKYADACKEDFDKTGITHKIAEVLVPFYKILYKKITDSSYRLNKSDYISLFVDISFATFLLVSYGMKFNEKLISSILEAIHEGRKLGINRNKSLLIYTFRNIPTLSKDLALVLARAAVDFLNPIPFVNLSIKFPSISKLFNNTFNVSARAKFKEFKHFNKVGQLNPKWSIKNKVINLHEHKPLEEGHFKNVYAITPETPYGLAEKDYYIKQGDNVYQVDWDSYSYTWRVIDQNNLSLSSYKTPVRWDDIEERWITHSFIPGRGGSPIDKVNLQYISKEEAIPLIKFVDIARQSALKKVTTIKTKMKNLSDDDENSINIAFDIFLGKHSVKLKEGFKDDINKQIEVLTNLNVNKDLIYNGGYDVEDTYTLMLTYENSYFTMKKKDHKPFINVYADLIVDLGDYLNYDVSQLKEYVSSTLMHEIHHATRLHSPDAAYPQSLYNKNIMIMELALDNIIKLSLPHLRKYTLEYIMTDINILAQYPDLIKDMQNIVDKKRLPNADNSKLDDELIELIEEHIDTADTKVLENPDNTVYLINLLYDFFTNKNKFNDFVKSYKRWLKEPKGHIIWNFESNLEEIPLMQPLKNTIIGELNNGKYLPLVSNTGVYYSEKAKNIKVPFEYITCDLDKLDNLKIKSLNTGKEKFIYNDTIVTTKGDTIKTRLLDNQILILKETFKLSDNINFINIGNFQTHARIDKKIVGIKIALNDIEYTQPVIIYTSKLGVSTVIHAIDDTHFYVYYCGQDIINSTIPIMSAHKKLHDNQEINKVIEHSSISELFKLFSSNYKKTLINYASLNVDIKFKEIVGSLKLNNIFLFNYNDKLQDYSKTLKVGQSYALLSKNMKDEPTIISYSESFDLNIDGITVDVKEAEKSSCILS